MIKRCVLLVSGLYGIFACKEQGESSKPIPSQVNSTPPPMSASLSMKGQNPFRLSLAPGTSFLSALALDTLLKALTRDSVLSDSILGTNECTGEEEHRVTLKSGLIWDTQGGNPYYEFSGPTRELLGLNPPFEDSQWIQRLGPPHQSDTSGWTYFSDQNDSSQLEYFQHRYEVKLKIENHEIKSLFILESFDDC